MLSNNFYIYAILLYVSHLETDDVATQDSKTDSIGHKEHQNHVNVTTHRTSSQQEYTNHLLSGIGTFTHCKSFMVFELNLNCQFQGCLFNYILLCYR